MEGVAQGRRDEDDFMMIDELRKMSGKPSVALHALLSTLTAVLILETLVLSVGHSCSRIFGPPIRRFLGRIYSEACIDPVCHGFR